MVKVRKYGRNSVQVNPSILTEQLSLVEMFHSFMMQKRTEGLAKRTIEEYEVHFEYLLNFLGGDTDQQSINIGLFRNYIDWMLNDKGLSPVTVNIRIRTIRAFIRFCFLEGHISSPIHEKIKILKTEQDTIESLTTTEIKLLLSKIESDSFVGFRDYVMICTLLDTMVRISELLAIKRSNVNIKEGFIELDAHETKARKSRTVPLSSKTSRLLSEYMKETEDFREVILFVTYDGKPIVANTFRKRLMNYAELAGITTKQVSPHIFRHTGALLYVLNGGDPFSLQKILGHSDMSMVRKYIQMTISDIKRQHNSFSPLKNIKI